MLKRFKNCQPLDVAELHDLLSNVFLVFIKVLAGAIDAVVFKESARCDREPASIRDQVATLQRPRHFVVARIGQACPELWEFVVERTHRVVEKVHRHRASRISFCKPRPKIS